MNGYSYDTLDSLTRVDQTGNGGNTVAEKRVDFAYNALGQFTSIARYKAVAGGSGNEVATSTYGYDAQARLTSLDHKKGAANIANYAWTFDTLNRVATFASPDGTATYKYDATSQLTSVDNTVLADESYVNDLNGNRASKGTANTTTGETGDGRARSCQRLAGSVT